MDFFAASIIAFFLMVSGGMVKGFVDNNKTVDGICMQDIEIWHNKITQQKVKVLHCIDTDIYRVIDDESFPDCPDEAFVEFNNNEFFKYYEKKIEALNLKTANGSLLQYKSK